MFYNNLSLHMFCDVESYLLIEELYSVTVTRFNFEIKTTEKGITIIYY